MSLFYVISYVIAVTSIFFYFRGNWLIIKVDKEIWKFGLWKSWISYKELKARSLSITGEEQLKCYKAAISMLLWSRRLAILIILMRILYAVYFSD